MAWGDVAPTLEFMPPLAPPTRDAIGEAAARILGRVRATPVLAVDDPLLAAAPVTLKLDLLQPTGSFKVRGAFSLLTSRDMTASGVIAASGGNFGLAVAYAARELGHPAHVFVPDTSPPEKIAGLRSLGADVRVVPGTYQQALDASEDFLAERGGLRAHAYDQPEVVAGQGTCAVELEQQVRDLDTVLVAVGGGGLLGGIASWFRGRVRVVGVETSGCDALAAARAAGRPVDIQPSGLCVSALGASRIGDLGFAAAEQWVEQVLVVADDDVREAQYRLWESARVVAEPGGAAAVAALTSGRYEPADGERVAVVVCGGNTDPGSVVRQAAST